MAINLNHFRHLLERCWVSLTAYHRLVSYKATLNNPVFPFPIELSGKTSQQRQGLMVGALASKI